VFSVLLRAVVKWPANQVGFSAQGMELIGLTFKIRLALP
jgi:hypothetical protein